MEIFIERDHTQGATTTLNYFTIIYMYNVLISRISEESYKTGLYFSVHYIQYKNN